MIRVCSISTTVREEEADWSGRAITIKGIKHMKTIKTIFIAIAIVVTVVFIALLIWLFGGAAEEIVSTYEIPMDFYISETNSETERIRAIQKSCEEYCKFKTLKKIEYTFTGYENIVHKDGSIVYGFEEYIDDSKEGGNVSVAQVHYNLNTNHLYRVDVFDGAGKAGSIGGKDLDFQNWNLSIDDIVDTFIEQYTQECLAEIQSPYLKVTIANDRAKCCLFSEDRKGAIETSTFDMKTSSES